MRSSLVELQSPHALDKITTMGFTDVFGNTVQHMHLPQLCVKLCCMHWYLPAINLAARLVESLQKEGAQADAKHGKHTVNEE